MSDLDELEQWLQERKQRAATQQAQEETGQRFDRLEGAVTELTNTFKEFVQKSAPPAPPGEGGNGGDGGATPLGDGGNAPPPPPAEPPPPELPVERVTLEGVPRVYSGDDEPETVTYLDAETGEEKTRPGRRKGQPTRVKVELVPADDGGEGDNE